jgi:hypothetical protein
MKTYSKNGGEWAASRPGRFIPGKESPGTHWIGDWVGPRICLDALHWRESNLGLSARSPTLYVLSYPDSSQ